MANRVLGIEIGENLTRVVEIDYKAKNPKIYNMFGFPTPPGMINDGVVQPDEEHSLTPEEIVNMDWLAENVVGHIPTIDELLDSAIPVVMQQGIK